jgi:hypothetical protein
MFVSQKQTENDDDFLLALEKMVSENVQDRLKEAVRPAQDIAVPILGKSHKANGIISFILFFCFIKLN